MSDKKINLTNKDYLEIYNKIAPMNGSIRAWVLNESYINIIREISVKFKSYFNKNDYRDYQIRSEFEKKQAEQIITSFLSNSFSEDVVIDIEKFIENSKHLNKTLKHAFADVVKSKINIYTEAENYINNAVFLKDERLKIVDFYLSGISENKVELNKEETKKTLLNIFKFINIYWGQHNRKLVFPTMNFIIKSEYINDNEKNEIYCKLLEKEPGLLNNKKEMKHINEYFKNADFTELMSKYNTIKQLDKKESFYVYDVQGKNYMLNIKSLAMENKLKSSHLDNNIKRLREYLFLKSKEGYFMLFDKSQVGILNVTVMLINNDKSIYEYINNLIEHTINMTKSGITIDTNKDYMSFELYNKLNTEIIINPEQPRKNKL